MLLAFVVLAQAADALTLALGVPVVGIHAEQNPLARMAYADGGIFATLLFKAVIVAVMVTIIWYFGRTQKQRLVLAAIAGGMGLFGTFGNILAIVSH